MPSPVRAFMATAGALMAAGALCASAASAAPVLYGATGVAADDTLPASNLYTINPDTGAATSIGSIGEAITGLAFDNADGGKLYGVTGGVYLSGKERKLLLDQPGDRREHGRRLARRQRDRGHRVHRARPALRLERDRRRPLPDQQGQRRADQGRRVQPHAQLRRRPRVRPQRLAVGRARR